VFKQISESNKHLLEQPAGIDIIYYSELREWYSNNAFRSFSVKYVIEHDVYYKAGKKEFRVTPGQYLLACRQPDVKAYFNWRTPAKAFCIDINPATMQETFSVLMDENDQLEDYLSGYFRSPEFFESINPAGTTGVGRFLQQLHQLAAGTMVLRKEWFYELCEAVIYQEYTNYLALKEINSVKAATRKEILRRLSEAKEYIDANFLHISGIKQIAGHCNMSEYHFYRRFKEVYKKTPYQCISENKLHLARQMLVQKQMNVSEVARSCGFNDIFSFSKSFKNYFSITPSALLA
jgi:AraC family transcriptional regulator